MKIVSSTGAKDRCCGIAGTDPQNPPASREPIYESRDCAGIDRRNLLPARGPIRRMHPPRDHQIRDKDCKKSPAAEAPTSSTAGLCSHPNSFLPGNYFSNTIFLVWANDPAFKR